MQKNKSKTHYFLLVAVPGELKGYWELHQKYGKLPWRELVEPTIELCRYGHEVSGYLARILSTRAERIHSEPTLAEIYINPVTNDTWREGDRIRRLKLADSLEIIAREGADALYSRGGSLLAPLIKDIESFNGIVTEDDFLNYK
jgi:gamma-glutamyltranspeptidase / glutathione hydrolase / leukotriene-C4 hydrolase